MQKNKLLTFIFMLFAVAISMQADVKTDYTESFDGLNVTNKDFHPKGWGHHYYNTSWGAYPATYTLVDEGKTGQYLNVVQKYPNYPSYDDILISPAVTGKVSLWIKSTGTSASVKFYKMTQNSDGKWTKGDEITPDVAPELNADFQEYVFNNITEATRIGIRGHQVGFDDFYAASAEIILVPSLEIGSTNTTAPSTVNFDAVNKYNLVISVALTNNGETDFNTGDENYTLTLRAGSLATSTEICTVGIMDNIAAGESKTRDYTFEIDGTKINGQHSLYLFENIKGTNSYVSRITFNPYMAKFVMKSNETSSSANNVVSGSTLDFGYVNAETIRTYYIYNEGTAPLKLDIEASEGFESSLANDVVIAAGDHTPISITMKTTDFGAKEGTLTIKGNDMENFILNLQGVVLDPSLWFQGFAEGTLPSDMVASSQWEFKSGDGGYAYVASSTASRLITPKLTVKEGQSLIARISKYSNSSWQNSIIKVYKLNSREDTGELVADFSSEAEYGKWKTITIDGIAAGEYYFAFDGAYINLDDIYGFNKKEMAHDLAVKEHNLPANGEVNSLLTATLSVQNLGRIEDAGSYKAQLFVNNEVVAEAEAVEIAAGSITTFNFTYTPHSAGSDMPIIIRLTSNADNTVIAQSQEGLITITEETPKTEIMVGKQSESNIDFKTPVYTTDLFSWSDIVYSANRLGLDTGTKISKIAFKGKNTNVDVKATSIKLWIENTDLTAAPSSWKDPSEMPSKEITEYTFPVVNDSDVLVVDMTEKPFIYNGGNLRMRFKTIMGKTGNVNFYYDDSSGNARYNNDNKDGTDVSLYKARVPLVCLSIAFEPIIVKGVVTNKSTNSPIANAKITIKSGDVEYYGISSEDGAYSITVLKKMPEYSVNVNLDGYFSYSEKVSLSEGENVHNIVLREAKDLFIVTSNVPTEGMVNHEYTASIDVKNVNADIFAADRYTVKMYFGEQLMATSPSKDIEAGVTEQFTLKFTPHIDGTFPARFVITWNDNSETTADVEVTIKKEDANGIAQVGTPSNADNETAPVYMNWEASASETVYDKNILNLANGCRILSIAYKGYTSKSHSDVAFKVWLQNTEDAAGSVGSFNRESMTLVYDATKTIEPAGSSSEPVELLRFDLATPFIYTGNNLRVIVQEVQPNYAGAFFECDTRMYNETKYARADKEESLLAADVYTGNTHSPVVYIGYSNSNKLEGSVLNALSNTPIENATITAISGDVIYSGKTNAEGRYSIDIVRHDKQYTVTAEAEKYDKGEPKEVSFATGDVTCDFALTPIHYTIRGTVTDSLTGYPIVNAAITAVSEDKSVSDITDSEGKYEIKIYDLDKEYSLSAVAEGYDKQEAVTIMVSDADVEQDFILTPVHCTISGTITDGTTAQPIANANVEAVSNGTVYNTTTNADGRYELRVYLLNTVYEMKVEAGNDYREEIKSITISDEDVTADFKLYTWVALGIETMYPDFSRGDIYDINGRKMRYETPLPRGIYIQNGKKFVVR